jgi:hypothetical protein
MFAKFVALRTGMGKGKCKGSGCSPGSIPAQNYGYAEEKVAL